MQRRGGRHNFWKTRPSESSLPPAISRGRGKVLLRGSGKGGGRRQKSGKTLEMREANWRRRLFVIKGAPSLSGESKIGGKVRRKKTFKENYRATLKKLSPRITAWREEDIGKGAISVLLFPREKREKSLESFFAFGENVFTPPAAGELK